MRFDPLLLIAWLRHIWRRNMALLEQPYQVSTNDVIGFAKLPRG